MERAVEICLRLATRRTLRAARDIFRWMYEVNVVVGLFDCF